MILHVMLQNTFLLHVLFLVTCSNHIIFKSMIFYCGLLSHSCCHETDNRRNGSFERASIVSLGTDIKQWARSTFLPREVSCRVAIRYRFQETNRYCLEMQET